MAECSHACRCQYQHTNLMTTMKQCREGKQCTTQAGVAQDLTQGLKEVIANIVRPCQPVQAIELHKAWGPASVTDIVPCPDADWIIQLGLVVGGNEEGVCFVYERCLLWTKVAAAGLLSRH